MNMPPRSKNINPTDSIEILLPAIHIDKLNAINGKNKKHRDAVNGVDTCPNLKYATIPPTLAIKPK